MTSHRLEDKMINCKCFECPLPDCVDPCPIRNNKNKQSYDDKKEKMKAYQRAYYLRNKEKLKAYKKAHYLKTKSDYMKKIQGPIMEDTK